MADGLGDALAEIARFGGFEGGAVRGGGEIDARLRPNGSKGLLVTPLSAYASYQTAEAWLWEHQALVRARFVAGDPALGTEFAALRTRVLLQTRDPAMVAKEVTQMRERWREALDRSDAAQFDLKQGRGGLVDIEFIAQQAVLAEGRHAAALARARDDPRS